MGHGTCPDFRNGEYPSLLGWKMGMSGPQKKWICCSWDELTMPGCRKRWICKSVFTEMGHTRLLQKVNFRICVWGNGKRPHFGKREFPNLLELKMGMSGSLKNKTWLTVLVERGSCPWAGDNDGVRAGQGTCRRWGTGSWRADLNGVVEIKQFCGAWCCGILHSCKCPRPILIVVPVHFFFPSRLLRVEFLVLCWKSCRIIHPPCLYPSVASRGKLIVFSQPRSFVLTLFVLKAPNYVLARTLPEMRVRSFVLTLSFSHFVRVDLNPSKTKSIKS